MIIQNKTVIVSIGVGGYYFNTLGLRLAEGREFDLNGNYDRDNSIMLNEAAVKSLQLEDPVGKKVAFKEVIGIVKDFPILSLYEKITPLYIFPEDDFTIYIINQVPGRSFNSFQLYCRKAKRDCSGV